MQTLCLLYAIYNIVYMHTPIIHIILNCLNALLYTLQVETKGFRSEKKIKNHNAFVLFYHRDGGAQGDAASSPDASPSSPDSSAAPLRAGVASDVLGLERALARAHPPRGGRQQHQGTSHPGLEEVLDTNQQVRRWHERESNKSDTSKLSADSCRISSCIVCIALPCPGPTLSPQHSGY